MSWEAWVTLAVVAAVVVVMARGRASPDMALLAALTIFVVFDFVPLEAALRGFSNPGVLTVGALFIVARGIRETAGLDTIMRGLLGRPSSVQRAQLKMMLPVSLVSAFVNNTPVVAMMMPVVSDWAKRCNLRSSKLLLPLSYASIFGGTCTIIGTSTNLVVVGLAAKTQPELTLGFFELAYVGVPIVLVGTAYVALVGRRLLPDRTDTDRLVDSSREYMVAMRVEPDSPIITQTIEQAGLRHLPGLFLVDIERDGDLIPAVAPTTRVRADDTLHFAGMVESVVDLRRIRGLVPAEEQADKVGEPRPNRMLIEAVVAVGSPLSGKDVRSSEFRTRYGAAIIAVRRGGERVAGKVGNIVLRAGDTLLLEARPAFLKRHRSDGAFALVREVEGSAPPRHERSGLAVALLAMMVVLSATGAVPLLVAAFATCALMLLTGCLDSSQAHRALDLRVLLAIAAAFGVGATIEATGVAQVVGQGLVRMALPLGPVGVLASVYVATALLTELLTNNAAALFMFPVAAAASQAAGIDFKPVMIVLMMAASASLSTPIGYQTNLMVFGPGGYRFSDFVKVGLPLQFIIAGVTLAVVQFVWM